jgi:hypothetical protein
MVPEGKGPWRATLGKLIASVDPLLEDYIEAAARAEHIPLDEYAGALLQVGWDAVFGVRRSDRLKIAASASRQAELRATFAKIRAGLAHDSGHNGDYLSVSPSPSGEG